MAIYIIDTNIFIQAHRRYYPLDVFVSFWDKLKELASNSTIISIDKVKHEIFPFRDDLCGWCQNHLPDSFFKNSDVFIREYASVINTVINSRRYKDSAIEEFSNANLADPYIIAACLSLSSFEEHIIVTEETGGDSISKVKIPDVCKLFNIPHVNTIEMLKNLGIKI